jgi:hypothetical protein
MATILLVLLVAACTIGRLAYQFRSANIKR